MSIIGTVFEDVTTDVIGSIGTWQWLVVCVCTALMIPSIFLQFEDMFLLNQVENMLCIPPSNNQVVNASLCFVQLTDNETAAKCERWYVKLMWMVWIQKSWMLFCDDKMKLVSTAMVSRVGQMFGFFIFGLISDSFGRKVSIVINVLAETSLGLLLTFCDSEACEIASNEWRSWLNTIVMLPRLLAFVCMVPLANCTGNQQTYNFIAVLYGAGLVVVLRWTPESPQWLLYSRKIIKAERLLLTAAVKNGIYLCSDFKIRPVNQRAYSCIEEPRTCLGVLTTYNIRIMTFISLLFWALYYFQWSYLYIRLYSDKSEEHLLLKIFCFAILFGGLTVLLARKMILRHLLLISVFITGIFMTGDAFLNKEKSRNLLSSIALASSIVGHALLLNITPRLFAIKVRGTLVGACQAVGEIGAILGYIIFLFDPMGSLTTMGVTIGITLTLSALCLMFLDVDGRELPDIMEDMDYFSELSKPLRWATQKTNSPSHEEVEMRIYSFNTVSSNSPERTSPARRIGFWRTWSNIRECMVNFVRRSK
ncbi:organic cation/carnitine transporter 2-like isoform X2 [Plodia interpunctella]|uniref:organic cation/carnitine transporter 2-like isoform X2 n=1 Tax=Plodia interpunctella TaxID=58824 RepID=UPI0023680768|nr:organic cation/carnitine transporter 2-like isoform X2 [Plodia interpunctella]